MIVDNFLKSYDQLKMAATHNDYHGVVNPEDGVLYPDISVDIPHDCLLEVQQRLDEAMGQPVVISMMFMRLTSSLTKGAPHQAHNDLVMGDYTLLLYLNDGPGGTSFVKHIETGMDGQPKTAEDLKTWERDTNNPKAWEITEMVDMKENRANIIKASRMHRAEPIGGFGEDASNGRIVLTAFFKTKGLQLVPPKTPEVHQATIDDVDRMVAYGQQFWHQTRYYKAGVEYHVETVTNMTRYLLDEGIVLYSEDCEGKIIALMLVIIAPLPMNMHHLVGCEWVFYVDESYRRGGLGVKLIHQAEKLLKEQRVKFFTMVSLTNVTPKAANKLYESLGFESSESSFTKDISWQP